MTYVPTVSHPPIIALSGPAGSGKSTVAARLASRYDAHRIRFADPLKAMLTAILVSAGTSTDMAYRMVEGDLKEVPATALCGRTPRHAMQTLGTEWGRDLMHPNLWIELWAAKARTALRNGFAVVVEDCRFLNEVRTVWDLGGKVVWIHGRSGIAGSHVSESGGAQHMADYHIYNDGDLAHLNRDVDWLWNKVSVAGNMAKIDFAVAA